MADEEENSVIRSRIIHTHQRCMARDWRQIAPLFEMTIPHDTLPRTLTVTDRRFAACRLNLYRPPGPSFGIPSASVASMEIDVDPICPPVHTLMQTEDVEMKFEKQDESAEDKVERSMKSEHKVEKPKESEHKVEKPNELEHKVEKPNESEHKVEISGVKKYDKKDEKKAFLTRDPSVSFPNLVKRHEAHFGKIYQNPSPTTTLPRLHNRKETYRKYDHQTSLIAYVRHYEIYSNHIYAILQFPNLASCALRLANFRPFFFLSVDDTALITDESDRKTGRAPTRADAIAFQRHLNSIEYRPKHFKGGPGGGGRPPKLPVMDVQLEYLRVADIYRGADEKGQIHRSWFYRIHFWNMSCLKWYRGKIARHEVNLDWNARMYHEHDHFTQINMLFCMTKLSYCQWVEFNARQVKWVPPDAQDSFGGHSDRDWTDAIWKQQLEDAKEENEDESDGKPGIGDEEVGEDSSSDENDKKTKKETNDRTSAPTRRKHRSTAEKGEYIESFSTACIMEGSIDFLKLTSRPDIVGFSPMIRIDVDIETISGRVVKHHLEQGMFPPRPPDEAVEPEHDKLPLDPAKLYQQLISKIREKVQTDELAAAEESVRIANQPKVKESARSKHGREQIEKKAQVGIKSFVQTRRTRVTDLANPNYAHLFLPSDSDEDDEEGKQLRAQASSKKPPANPTITKDNSTKPDATSKHTDAKTKSTKPDATPKHTDAKTKSDSGVYRLPRAAEWKRKLDSYGEWKNALGAFDAEEQIWTVLKKLFDPGRTYTIHDLGESFERFFQPQLQHAGSEADEDIQTNMIQAWISLCTYTFHPVPHDDDPSKPLSCKPVNLGTRKSDPECRPVTPAPHKSDPECRPVTPAPHKSDPECRPVNPIHNSDPECKPGEPPLTWSASGKSQPTNATKEKNEVKKKEVKEEVKKKEAKEEDEKKEYKTLQYWPEPNNPEDPVGCIVTHLHLFGDKEPVVSVVHALGTSLPLKHAQRHVTFEWTDRNDKGERNMIGHWCHMVRTLWDASVFETYNGIGYDLPYLAIRAQKVQCERFFHMGIFLAKAEDRVKGELSDGNFYFRKRYQDALVQIRAPLGVQKHRRDDPESYTFPGVNVIITGIFQMDVLKIIRTMNYKSDTHKLKDMCSLLLENFNKRDMAGEYITPSWATNELFQRFLRDYCWVDGVATGALADKTEMPAIMTEQPFITRTSQHDIVFHGQQKKTWNQLVFAAYDNGWLLDEEARKDIQKHYKVAKTVAEYLKTNTQKNAERAKKQAMTKAELRAARLKYAGGYVQKPKRKVYTIPAFTKDFNSLYPTVIIGHKLCPSTWVEHAYDEKGRLWFPRYGATYDECWKNSHKFLIWRLCDLKPEPSEVGNRDLILVVTDWGKTSDGIDLSIPAAKWDAYCMWKKMAAKRKVRAPFRTVFGTNQTPAEAKTPPPPEFIPPPNKLYPEAGGTGSTCCFVQNRPCVFPPILEKLLALRKEVKKLQAAAEAVGDDAMAKIYEARQLVVKLAANASYGFMGAVEGFHGVVPIAAATCLLGRHYIMLSIFTCLYEYYAPSIYGDTDSMFATYNFLEKLPANGEWPAAQRAKRLMKDVLRACQTELERKSNAPFVPSAAYVANRSMDNEKVDYNADFPLDKAQLDPKGGIAAMYIKTQLETAQKAKNEDDVLAWSLVAARAEIALNVFFMGRKERGEKVAKSKKKGKEYTKPLIPDLVNVDFWRLYAMKVQADAAAEEISERCQKPMKIENEKIILRIALFDRKMYGYRQILPKPKSDTRGLGTVRKDVAPAVRDTQSGLLEKILDAPLQDIEILTRILHRRERDEERFKWQNKDEIEEYETARNKMLEPMHKTMSKLLDRKLNLDDWQRTIAKPDRVSNVKTQTVQAIAKDELRRQATYETKQRLLVLVVMPEKLPKVTMTRPKDGSASELRYDLSGLYRCTEVRSYVEEQGLKLHRAYYHGAAKKKVRQTCSVILTESEIEASMMPYLLRIYRDDFGIKSLADCGFTTTIIRRQPMVAVEEKEDSDDEAEEEAEHGTGVNDEYEIEDENNDVGLDLDNR